MCSQKKTCNDKCDRNKLIIDAAYKMFVKYKIEGTTFQMIAKEAGVGVATVFRHYSDKADLAIKVISMKWKECLEAALKNRSLDEIEKSTAVERLEYTLNAYIYLYCYKKDFLVFNDNFNHYMAHEDVDKERFSEYYTVTSEVSRRFHFLYEKAKKDHTIRTDISEDKLLRILLHTMMSACAHYAGGIIWAANENEDYKDELLMVKAMILEFATKGV